MSDEHEIGRLRLEIAGELRVDQDQRIEKKVLQVIEKYFDQYDRGEAQWLIHRIHLDLGTIDAKYLEQEIEVRFSYILDQELRKWASLSPEELANSFSDPVYGEIQLFKTYLEKGFNPKDERDLSKIFEDLLSSDFENLRILLNQLKRSDKLRKRLRLQVKPELLKRFWARLSPKVYQAVEEVEEALGKDLKLSIKDSKTGLPKLLQKLRFDFLIASQESKAPHASYIDLFIKHIDSFKAYEHLVDESFFRYFARLQNSFKAGEKSEESKEGQGNWLEKAGAFIQSGKSSSRKERSLMFKQGTKFLPSELDVILRKVSWSGSETELLKKAGRAHSLFGNKGFELFLHRLIRLKDAKPSKASQNLIQLRKLLAKEFRINLFDAKNLTAELFVSLIHRGRIPEEELKVLLSLYAAKMGLAQEGLKKRLMQRLSVEEESFYQELKLDLAEMPEIQEREVNAQRRELRKESDILRAFIYFLASGVWLTPERSSQSVLEELLEVKASFLRQRLISEIRTEVIWSRLIYQHLSKNVFEIFQLIFGGKDVSALAALLAEGEKANKEVLVEIWKVFKSKWDRIVEGRELERKILLESFYQAFQLRFRSSEIEFTEVFNRITDELNEQSKEGVEATLLKEESRMKDLLELTYSAKFESPDRENAQQLIDYVRTNPRLLKLMMWDRRIPEKRWSKLLENASRPQILEWLKLVYDLRKHEAWISEWLEFESKTKRPPFTERTYLFRMMIPLAKGQDEVLKSAFRSRWKKLKLEKGESRSSVLKGFPELLKSIGEQRSAKAIRKDFLLFTELLMRYLESGRLPRAESSMGQSEFELTYIEAVRGTKLNLLLQRAEFAELLRMHRSFSKKNRRPLLRAFDEKFGDKGFLKSIQSAAQSYALGTELEELELIAISHASQSDSFQPELFHLFLQSNYPYQIDHVQSSSSPSFQTDYVELDKLLSLGLEGEMEVPEKLEEMLMSTMVFHRKKLFDAIRQSASPSLFIRKILNLLDSNRREVFIAGVFNIPVAEFLKLLAETSKTEDDSEFNLIQAIEFQIRSRKDLQLEDLKAIWEQKASLSYRAFLSELPTDQQHIEKITKTTLSKIPPEVLRFGIRSEVESRQVFDLLDELLESGRVPSWSSLQSKSELHALIKQISALFPSLFKRKVSVVLESEESVERLFGLIGEKGMQDLLKSFYPDLWQEWKLALRQLQSVLSEVISKDSLELYMKPRLLSMMHRSAGNIRLAILDVVQTAILEFGLSRQDLLEGISKKRSKLASDIKERLALLDSASASYESSSEWDLLIYMLLRKQLPWWASSQFEPEKKSLKKQREDLVDKLLSESPKVFLQKALISGQFEEILTELLKEMKLDGFERLLIGTSPNLGGFSISFNLLVYEFSDHKLPDAWKVESIKWFTQNTKSGPESYLRFAFFHFSSKLNMKAAELGKTWMSLVDNFIEAGQVRFLPLKQLLKQVLGEEPREDVSMKRSLLSFKAVYDLQFLFQYYVRSGSLPVGTPYEIDFKSFLASLFSQSARVKETLVSVLEESFRSERIMKRVARDEMPVFQHFLIELLYPKQRERLLVNKTKLAIVLPKLHKSFTVDLWEKAYISSMLEMSRSPQRQGFSTQDLMIAAIQKLLGAQSLSMEDLKKARKKLKLDSESKALFDQLQKLGEEARAPNEQSSSEKKARNEEAQTPVPDQLEAESNEEGARQVEGDLEVQGREREQKLKKLLVEKNEQKESEDDILEHRILIKNAGMVIAWPYFSRYFEMLEMVENGAFKTEADAVRGVHLLQFVATGEAEAPEHELILNKVLCGLKLSVPVPLEIALTENEIKTSEMMLGGLMQNWEKMKGSSAGALREGFLIRDGFIEETEKTWELKVEKKTLDILMESMPWAFGMIKLPWMEKRLNVEWL